MRMEGRERPLGDVVPLETQRKDVARGGDMCCSVPLSVCLEYVPPLVAT